MNEQMNEQSSGPRSLSLKWLCVYKQFRFFSIERELLDPLLSNCAK